MISRLVKMTFHAEKVPQFLKIFEENKKAISSFDGCVQVELKRDVKNSNIFFTVSQWRSEEDLNNYRKSELFNSVWGRTKVLFQEKAEAWTLN
ncbi:MAG: antibiotic biosynthesis monooxygenase [Bacteroidetes bacterium]|nr:antibiotic biosynthesis monooxygenase [Bacteroidota bacterium]